MTEKVWEVFHGTDLDILVDRAHSEVPWGYQIDQVDVKFINSEYVVIAVLSHEIDDSDEEE